MQRTHATNKLHDVAMKRIRITLRLRVSAIIAVTLTVGVIRHSLVAQEAEPAEVQPVNVTYAINYSFHQTTICIGETFGIDASIVANIEAPEDSNAPVRENAAVFTVTGASLSATHSSILTTVSTPN